MQLPRIVQVNNLFPLRGALVALFFTLAQHSQKPQQQIHKDT